MNIFANVEIVAVNGAFISFPMRPTFWKFGISEHKREKDAVYLLISPNEGGRHKVPFVVMCQKWAYMSGMCGAKRDLEWLKYGTFCCNVSQMGVYVRHVWRSG